MSLAAGARIGAYEIVSLLGAGGMGEVYRATDHTLARDVAIKVLPDPVAADPDRLARFRREAQVLASLNHPHIAAIYGFEQSDGIHALVLELVEGPTLADRIAEGAIPIDEALPIAKQIADALEGAHEQGIIHRDLKPANIKLRTDGTVKVLDFGLAKALETGAASGTSVTMSPTLTSPALMTGMGVMLGTAAYMSPEQAKGRAVDKRSDIWAFGCVLYEMLTGTRPFEAEDIAETLACVLTKEPDWSRLPSRLPPAVSAVLRRCFVKDRRQRIGDIAAVQFAFSEPTIISERVGPATVDEPSSWRRLATYAAVLLVGVIVTSIGAWAIARMNARTPQPVRFTITPPAEHPLSVTTPGSGGAGLDRAIGITPDGTHLFYRVGDNTQNYQLMVRAVDQIEARPLPGLGAHRDLAVSPDGKWVATFVPGELRKVSVDGGPPIVLCRIQAAPRGVTWADDDTVYFALNGPNALYSVPASGGEPRVIAKSDPSRNENPLFFPSALPGGRGLLVTILAQTSLSGADSGQIAWLDPRTGDRKTLVRGGSFGQYVDSGHIVYAAGGSLRAVPFDLRRLEITGDSVAVVDGVMALAGGAQFAVSRTGTLIYVPGVAGAVAPQYTLTWVNRQGKEEPIGAPPRAYQYPRISPDGSRLALDVRDQENDIWIWDLKRQTMARLTFDPGLDRAPIWTPDGRRVIYSSQRGGNGGAANIFWQAADGTGTVERLTISPTTQYPTSISPDGTKILLRDDNQQRRRDVAVLSLDGNRQTQTLFQTPFDEENAEFSPDGRWVAYQSNESGQSQIIVRPFPQVDAGRWQISTSGGTRPTWARNGHELFYLDAGGVLTSVPVQTMPTFSAGNPAKVFETRYLVPNNARTYDVSPDGQRFVMIKGPADDGRASAASLSLVVVLNWFEELKQRVPVK
jgi:eukaryotic-like serine/threonine-protein kinase